MLIGKNAERGRPGPDIRRDSKDSSGLIHRTSIAIGNFIIKLDIFLTAYDLLINNFAYRKGSRQHFGKIYTPGM
jgi:hypothetical protein